MKKIFSAHFVFSFLHFVRVRAAHQPHVMTKYKLSKLSFRYLHVPKENQTIMKSFFKIILYLATLKSNLAIFENPFQIRHLFGRLFELDSKIRQNQYLVDENIKIFQDRVSNFRQEIEKNAQLLGFEKFSDNNGYLG